jgi:hypothetical protein
LLAARIMDYRTVNPEPGLVAAFGLSVEEFTAPLVLSESNPGDCPGHGGCGGEGQRLVLEVDSPHDPPARLRSGTQGQGGSGYWVASHYHEQWVDNCAHFSYRDFFVLRQDCAPDCGPVASEDACEPPLASVDMGRMNLYFKPPTEIAYDITCMILEQDRSFKQPFQGFEWRHRLDCIGLP